MTLPRALARDWLARTADYLVGIVFVLAPFHAFLTVWGSTWLGHFLWLRLWDELLLAVLVGLVGSMLWRDRQLFKKLVSGRLVQLIGAYIGIVVLWGVVSYALHQMTLPALAYGVAVDTRFLVWFIAIWVVVQRSQWLQTHWKRLVFWPLIAVVIFGLLQFFVWPPNFLTHFGYGPNTYVPYITLNQNSSIVRIQSTLRGANALGAYLAVAGTLLVASLSVRGRRRFNLILLAATSLALVLTFSRSGWLAAVVGGATVIAVGLKSKVRPVAIGLAGVSIIIVSLVIGFALRTNTDAQDLLYHVSDHTTAKQTSNQQHTGAFTQGLSTIIREPLGRGPGTSGQASWYNAGHPVRNPESLLLQIGEETGWLGLVLFIAIVAQLSRELWSRCQNSLALALFASLIGITLISFVTYSWIDDTLAFIWWGLAAIALSQHTNGKNKATI